MKQRVVIVDDHQLVLDGLARIIKATTDFELLAMATNGKELLELLPRLPVLPDIILMDIDMSLGNGLETTRSIKKIFPGIKVLIVTMHEGDIYYNKAIVAKADGLIMKNSSQLELLNALRKICSGSSFFLERADEKRVENEVESDQHANLTEREVEVLKKIALGMSNTEISKALGISVRTVDTHRTNLKKKLDVNGIAGLVRYAYQHGLLS